MYDSRKVRLLIKLLAEYVETTCGASSSELREFNHAIDMWGVDHGAECLALAKKYCPELLSFSVEQQ